MKFPFVQIDAFTDKPFSGNSAAVLLLEKEQPADWMQTVAMEMNLSETAFLLRRGENEFHLRWFTPKVEVELCGHATLASAHFLFEKGYAEGDIRFQTRSGELSAKKVGDKIELDFPAGSFETYPDLDMMERVLGRRPKAAALGASYIAQFETEDEVKSLQPDFKAVAALGNHGVLATAPGKDFDFVSRCFFPEAGIDEDPVTGSAHCLLGAYWKKILEKNTFLAYQASERGGILDVEVLGERVKLRGNAVTVIEGELVL